jgi:hypothetical protein
LGFFCLRIFGKFFKQLAFVLAVFAPEVFGAEIARYAIDSPRDVDITYADDTLVVLAQSGGRWTSFSPNSSTTLVSRCSYPGKSWFSHDRTHIVSLSGGSQLHIFPLTDCEEKLTLTLPHRIRDADVHFVAERVVISTPGTAGLELRLFDFKGEPIATLGSARNAEIGFSPLGDVVFNFDHAGGTTSAWAPLDGLVLPALIPDGFDAIYAGDGETLFATKPSQLTIAQGLRAAPPVEDKEVLRGTSHAGTTLVLQSPNPLQPAWPKVRLFDTATGRSVPLGSGHIDATALSKNGTRAAIAIRAQKTNRITITQTKADALFTP